MLPRQSQSLQKRHKPRNVIKGHPKFLEQRIQVNRNGCNLSQVNRNKLYSVRCVATRCFGKKREFFEVKNELQIVRKVL